MKLKCLNFLSYVGLTDCIDVRLESVAYKVIDFVKLSNAAYTVLQIRYQVKKIIIIEKAQTQLRLEVSIYNAYIGSFKPLLSAGEGGGLLKSIKSNSRGDCE
jgi:hypothetical protein